MVHFTPSALIGGIVFSLGAAIAALVMYFVLIIANPFSIPAPIEPTALEMLMNKDLTDVLAGL
jgi:hypothetical protein